MSTATTLTDRDYRALAQWRHALRRFLRFSEEAARAAGLTPAQHQLLLAVRGHTGDGPPSTSELAASLQLRLHSVGELIDRAAANGLVTRHADAHDHRRALVSLTPTGAARLAALSVQHRAELGQFRRQMADLIEILDEPHPAR